MEHDLSTGLRDHFDPKARWRAAITSARAIHRLNSFANRNSKSSSVNLPDDSDDDDDIVVRSTPTSSAISPASLKTEQDRGSNEFVNVISPEEEELVDAGILSVEDIPKPIPYVAEKAPPIVINDANTNVPIFTDAVFQLEPEPMTETELGEPLEVNVNDDELRMPGSFDLPTTAYPQPQASWGEMFKKFQLK